MCTLHLNENHKKMEEIAAAIQNIIKGYRNEDGIHIQTQDVLDWAYQFGDDAEFMLSEVHHLLKQIYLSKEDAIKALRGLLNNQYKDYGFTSIEEYLQQTCFLKLQHEGKSQHVYLEMMDQIVYAKTNHHLSDYDTYPKTLFVYLDDVLASGGTIRRDLRKWLASNDHAKLLKEHKIKLELSLICVHTMGLAFMEYGLKKEFGNFPLKYRSCYEIQNHLKWINQALNIAIPVKDQPKEVKEYLAQLDAEKYEDYAYRDSAKPEREIFFSSVENRVKFENLLLEKGLYIINQIKGEIKPNIRPLGLINPNYKTFGLGTHFFTWRNVPNNCPLVYWWDVSGHDWKPLFPPKR